MNRLKFVLIVLAGLLTASIAFSQTPQFFKEGIILGGYSTDPTGYRAGQLYWNTTELRLKQYNGTTWDYLEAKLSDVFKKSGTTESADNSTEDITRTGKVSIGNTSNFGKFQVFNNNSGSEPAVRVFSNQAGQAIRIDANGTGNAIEVTSLSNIPLYTISTGSYVNHKLLSTQLTDATLNTITTETGSVGSSASNGFGIRKAFALQASTGPVTNAAFLDVSWDDSSTQKGRLSLKALGTGSNNDPHLELYTDGSNRTTQANGDLQFTRKLKDSDGNYGTLNQVLRPDPLNPTTKDLWQDAISIYSSDGVLNEDRLIDGVYQNTQSITLPNSSYTLTPGNTYRIVFTLTGGNANLYLSGDWGSYTPGTYTDYFIARSNSSIFAQLNPGASITSFQISEVQNNTLDIVNNLNIEGAIKTNGHFDVENGRHISIGYQALHNTTQGTYGTYASNIGIGWRAGYTNTVGHVTAVGYRAGESNTGDGVITAMGKWALLNNTTGHATAFGNAALRNNTTSNSHAFGDEALAQTTTNDATGFGYYAGNGATGIGTYFGTSAGYLASTGEHTLFGHRAGYRAGSSQLTAIGHRAAENVVSGSGVYLGYGAGYLSTNVFSTDTKVVAIGDRAGKNTASILDNVVAIGDGAEVEKSNQIVLGDTNITEVKTSGDVLANGYKSSSDISDTLLTRNTATTISGTINYAVSNNRLILRADVFVDYDGSVDYTIATLPVGARPNVDRNGILLQVGPNETRMFSILANGNINVSISGTIDDSVVIDQEITLDLSQI